MEEQPPQPQAKWEGEVSAETTAAKPEEIWPMLADDFCSIHKWLPIDTCHHVEGEPGQPGLIRYCATTDPTLPGTSTKWAHERLKLIDPTAHIYSHLRGPRKQHRIQVLRGDVQAAAGRRRRRRVQGRAVVRGGSDRRVAAGGVFEVS